MTRLLIPVIIVLLVAGCSQSLYMQGRHLAEQGEYDQAITLLYDEIRANPESADAWRELGVAYYKKGELAKAEDALKQAHQIRPDARTNLYFGMIHEKREQWDAAVRAYSTAMSLEPKRETKNLVQAHLDQLMAMKFRREAERVVADENSIKADTIPQNTVAVIDFDGSTLPPDLAPISLGLAEFTSTDLSKIGSLRVIDRLKINVLLDELKLSESKYVDPASAPRVGRMVGSRRIITGSVLSTGDNKIRLDGAIVSTTSSETELPPSTEGSMDDFFRVQKEFVFKVIDQLGVTLTAAERDAIMEIPTESYLAFMAYCRGLDFKRHGMPQAAEREFTLAVDTDPGFGEAGRQAGSLAAAAEAGGPGGEYSLETFEGSVDSRTRSATTAETDTDTRILTVIENSGIIPQRQINRGPNRQPIITRNGTVIIQGAFDD